MEMRARTTERASFLGLTEFVGFDTVAAGGVSGGRGT